MFFKIPICKAFVIYSILWVYDFVMQDLVLYYPVLKWYKNYLDPP